MALAAATLPAVFNNPVTHDGSAMINGSVFGDLYLGTNRTTAKDDFREKFATALRESTPSVDLEDLLEIEGTHVPGTCEWFVNTSQFDLWSSTMAASILWAPGRPGVGKTFMSVYLIKALQPVLSRQPRTRLLYFFFKHQDLRKNTALAVIRSLLCQILQYQPDLMESCLTDYITFKDVNSILQNKDALWKLFQRVYLTSGADMVFFVLDALDECEEERDWLVEKLVGLRTVTRPAFKLLLTSRGLSELARDLLEPCAIVNLDPETNEQAETGLTAFINASLQDLSRRKRYRPDIEEKLRQSLTNRAGGTFLWVSCALKMLRNSPASEVDEIIQILPKELNGHFFRMISLIDSDRRGICANILKWVATAFRPLTIAELAVATCVTSEWGIDPLQKMRDRVEACGGMLKIVGGEVRFIHETAKSYLTDQSPGKDLRQSYFHVSTPEANLDLCLFCIEYLQQGSLHDDDIDLYELGQTPRGILRQNQFPLLAYCVRYWPIHAQRAFTNVERLKDALEQWSRANPRSWNAWLRTFWRSELRGWEIPKTMSLLQLSSFFGIDRLIVIILSDQKRRSERCLRSSLDERGIYDMTALHWAAGKGHKTSVEVLLDHGADVGAKGDFFTPLCWAIRNGHTEVAEVLIKGGAHLEQKSWGATPLCWAAWAGKDDILQLLLSKSSDPNTHTVPGPTQALNLYHQSKRKESELRWLSVNEVRKINRAAERVEAEEVARSTTDSMKLLILWVSTSIICAQFFHELMYQICFVQAHKYSWLAARRGTMYGQSVSWAVLTLRGRARFLRDVLLQPRTVISVARMSTQQRPFISLFAAVMLCITFGYAATQSAILLVCFWLAISVAEWMLWYVVSYLGFFAIPAWVYVIRSGAFWLGAMPGVSQLTWRISTVVWSALVCFISWAGYERTALAANAIPFWVWSIGSIVIGQQAGAVSGDTALHLAAGRGHVGCVRPLLAQHYDPYTRNRDGRTAVQLALHYNHIECVKTMIQYSAGKMFVKVDDLPLYHLAAICGDIEVMAYLDARGLNVNESSRGTFAAHHAAAAGKLRVLEYLQSLNKIDMSPGTLTPLHIASIKNHLDCCSFLFAHGVPVDIVEANGRTPLHAAVMNGHLDAVKLFLGAGASAQVVDHFSRTALHYAVLKGSRDICEVLVSQGVRLDAVDCVQETPLMLAAKSGHAALIEWLLAQGSNANLKNVAGSFALGLAVTHGHLDCVNCLLRHGADVNDRDGNGDSALHVAVYRYKQGMFEQILDAGGDPTLQNAFKQTPFDWALKYPSLTSIMQHRFPMLSSTDKAEIEAAVAQSTAAEAASLLGEAVPGRDFMRLILLLRQLHWYEAATIAWRWMKRRGSSSDSFLCTGCTQALLGDDIFMCNVCYDFTLCSNCMHQYNEQALTRYLCQDHDFYHVSTTTGSDELSSDQEIVQVYQDEWLTGLIRWCNDGVACMSGTIAA